MSEDGTRLSVNINPECTAVIRDYMHTHGVSATETIRRAVAVLMLLDGANRRGEEIRVGDRIVMMLH